MAMHSAACDKGRAALRQKLSDAQQKPGEHGGEQCIAYFKGKKMVPRAEQPRQQGGPKRGAKLVRELGIIGQRAQQAVIARQKAAGPGAHHGAVCLRGGAVEPCPHCAYEKYAQAGRQLQGARRHTAQPPHQPNAHGAGGAAPQRHPGQGGNRKKGYLGIIGGEIGRHHRAAHGQQRKAERRAPEKYTAAQPVKPVFAKRKMFRQKKDTFLQVFGIFIIISNHRGILQFIHGKKHRLCYNVTGFQKRCPRRAGPVRRKN